MHFNISITAIINPQALTSYHTTYTITTSVTQIVTKSAILTPGKNQLPTINHYKIKTTNSRSNPRSDLSQWKQSLAKITLRTIHKKVKITNITNTITTV